MKEFFIAVILCLIIGLCAVVLVAQIFRIRRKRKNDEVKETYILEGMCLGICFGASLTLMGIDQFGVGPCFGMLAGEVVGMMISKKGTE